MNNIISNCTYCGTTNTNRDTGFCSQFCFNQWFFEMEAVELIAFLNSTVFKPNDRIQVGTENNADDGKRKS